MKKHLLIIAFAVVALFGFNPGSNQTHAAPIKKVMKVTALSPINVGGTNALGTFAGQFSIQRFANQSGQLVAVGSLTGTFTDLLGNVTNIVNQIVSIPVTSATGTCSILHLELGPLDLNLLGLMIHLDKVVLDISAQSGPGNLLGNLLCAVSHLLDGGGPLGSISNLLNRIIGLL